MVRTRLKILILLLTLPFLGMLWRLAALQLSPGSHERYALMGQHRSRRFAGPQRGRILASDGTVLAGNQSTFNLDFTYRTLDPRRKALSILVRELTKQPSFSHTMESITEVLQQIGDPRALASAPDSGEHAWRPLFEDVARSTAKTLGRKLSRYGDIFEVRYPEGSSGLGEVWVCPRGALRMEITLYRVAQLLDRSAGLSLEPTFDRLRARVAEVLESVETGVEREARSDKEKGIRESVITGATQYRRGLHYERPVLLCSDVSMSTVTAIEYHAERFPGIRCVDESRRNYPLKEVCGPLTGHVRGLAQDAQRISRLTEDGRLLDARAPFETMDEFRIARKTGLRSTDDIGVSGLESAYDERLRGLHGMSIVSVDQHGKPRRILEDLPARDGEDVRTTIDAPLQVLLYDALRQAVTSRGLGRAANAAVMEVASGALLASVSYPAVDPNRPWEESYVTEMNALWGRESGWRMDGPSRRPLFPGSIFKIVVAAGAVESAPGYTPQMRYPCRHKFDLISKLSCNSVNGHTPDGTVNLSEALQFSCNNYFYYLALRHLKAEGIFGWGQRFGFGRPTEIDLGRGGTETGLLRPPDEVKGDVNACYYSIGQVHVKATPLQVVGAVAAIAGGGRYLPRPYLSTKSKPEDLGLDPATVEVLRDGMWRVGHASNGTAAKEEFGLYLFSAAFKTGTAEVQVGSEMLHNAWLVGFAPFENPHVAFVAVVEKTSLHGAEACAPIVRKLLEYFAHKDPQAYLLEEAG